MILLLSRCTTVSTAYVYRLLKTSTTGDTRHTTQSTARSEITKVLLAKALHLKSFGHWLQKMLDLLSPESVLWVDLASSNVFPIRRVPTRSLPVYNAHDIITADENVETAQITVGEAWAVPVLAVQINEFVDLVVTTVTADVATQVVMEFLDIFKGTVSLISPRQPAVIQRAACHAGYGATLRSEGAQLGQGLF